MKKIKSVPAVLLALIMVVTMSMPVFACGIDSKAALNKALKNAHLKKSQITRIDTDYNSENCTYEIAFTRKSNGKHYEYRVSAASGKILEKEVDYKHKKNSSRKKIGVKAARKKVARFSGIDFKIIKAGTYKYKYENREGFYEIRFRKGNLLYEYEVVAPTGKVKEYEWKLIR